MLYLFLKHDVFVWYVCFLFAKQNALVCEWCFVFANHTEFVCESLGVSKTCFVCLWGFGMILTPYTTSKSVKTSEYSHKIKQNSIMSRSKIMILQEYCQLTMSSFDGEGVSSTSVIEWLLLHTSCDWVNDMHKCEFNLSWNN